MAERAILKKNFIQSIICDCVHILYQNRKKDQDQKQ